MEISGSFEADDVSRKDDSSEICEDPVSIDGFVKCCDSVNGGCSSDREDDSEISGSFEGECSSRRDDVSEFWGDSVRSGGFVNCCDSVENNMLPDRGVAVKSREGEKRVDSVRSSDCGISMHDEPAGKVLLGQSETHSFLYKKYPLMHDVHLLAEDEHSLHGDVQLTHKVPTDVVPGGQ